MSLYIIMYRESVREIVESEEFAQVVSDSTRQHFKVHRHTNLTVVSLVIYQRECLQKMKGGYRLTAKKGLSVASNLTSICCVYKEKIVKNDLFRRTWRPSKFKKLIFRRKHIPSFIFHEHSL